MLSGDWSSDVCSSDLNEHAGFGYRILSSTANHAARKPVPGTKCIEVGTGLTWTVAFKDGEFFAIRKKAQPQWME